MTDMNKLSPEDIRSVVNRLCERNRHKWAIQIYGNWIDLRRKCEEEDNLNFSLSLDDLWKYGCLLRDAKDYLKAANVFREIIIFDSRKSTKGFYELRSYEELANCLDAVGHHRSAVETRDLATRVESRRKEEEEEHGDGLKALKPSRLIASVASRITFSMSLGWESISDSFELRLEDKLLTLRDRFNYEDGPWLEFEAKAPDVADCDYPHVSACVRLPWSFSGIEHLLPVFELVNEMNFESGSCSVSLEPGSSQVAIQSRICFTGYNFATPDLEVAQGEATMNMFADVMSMGINWAKRIENLYSYLKKI